MRRVCRRFYSWRFHGVFYSRFLGHSRSARRWPEVARAIGQRRRCKQMKEKSRLAVRAGRVLGTCASGANRRALTAGHPTRKYHRRLHKKEIIRIFLIYIPAEGTKRTADRRRWKAEPEKWKGRKLFLRGRNWPDRQMLTWNTFTFLPNVCKPWWNMF